MMTSWLMTHHGNMSALSAPTTAARTQPWHPLTLSSGSYLQWYYIILYHLYISVPLNNCLETSHPDGSIRKRFVHEWKDWEWTCMEHTHIIYIYIIWYIYNLYIFTKYIKILIIHMILYDYRLWTYNWAQWMKRNEVHTNISWQFSRCCVSDHQWHRKA